MENSTDSRAEGLGGIISPEVARIINYKFETLYAKIDATEHMCPELRKLLDYCKYQHELRPESLNMYEITYPKPIMRTLLLIEDVLERKVTREEFETRRKKVLGEGKPWMVKLGLLLLTLGAVFAGAGLFLGYGIGVVAEPALGAGLSFTFLGQAPRVSKLTADAGEALYNRMTLP